MIAIRLAVGLCLLWMLSACGGGGGPGTSITVSPTSLEFQATTGGAISTARQSVTANYEGDGVIVGYAPGALVPSWLAIEEGTLTEDRATFFLSATAYFLEPGTYSASVRFVTGRVKGDEVDENSIVYDELPVTFKVKPFAITPSSQTVTLISGGSAASNKTGTFAITSETNWTISSGSSWLLLDRTSGSGSANVGFTVVSKDVPAGSSFGYITLQEVGTSATRTVSVVAQARVPNFQNQPSSLSVSVTDSTTSDLLPPITISDDAGSIDPAGSVSWTLNIDQAWLKSDVTSGQTVPSSTLQLRLHKEALTNLPNGTYTARVRFGFTRANGTTGIQDLLVTLTLSRSSLSAVSSSLGFVGQQFDVALFGAFPSSSGLQVKFGDVAVTPTYVNTGELRVTYPALGAGTYPVTLAFGGTGIANPTTSPNFTVIAQQTLPAATLTLSSASLRNTAVYDPRRQSLYVQAGSLGTLDVFTLKSGVWEKSLTTPNFGGGSGVLLDLALTSDGQKLIVSGPNNLYELNPSDNSLASKKSLSSVQSIASLPDRNIFVRGQTSSTNFIYNPVTTALDTFSATGSAIAAFDLFPSGDSRLLLVPNAGGMAVYYPSLGSIISTGITQSILRPAVSRSGHRFFGDQTAQLYQAGSTQGLYSVIGTLSSAPGTVGNTMATRLQLSPDGTRAYATEMSAANQPVAVREYDVTASSPTPYTSSKSYPLPDNMNGGVTTAAPFLTIAPDGKTLFVIGGVLGAVVPLN